MLAAVVRHQEAALCVGGKNGEGEDGGMKTGAAILAGASVRAHAGGGLAILT
jgi:hypothetical protein